MRNTLPRMEMRLPPPLPLPPIKAFVVASNCKFFKWAGSVLPPLENSVISLIWILQLLQI